MNRCTLSLIALFIPITFFNFSMNGASASAAAIKSNNAAFSPIILFPPAHEIADLVDVPQPTRYSDSRYPDTDQTLVAYNTPVPATGGAAKMLAVARKLKATPAHAKK